MCPSFCLGETHKPTAFHFHPSKHPIAWQDFCAGHWQGLVLHFSAQKDLVQNQGKVVWQLSYPHLEDNPIEKNAKKRCLGKRATFTKNNSKFYIFSWNLPFKWLKSLYILYLELRKLLWNFVKLNKIEFRTREFIVAQISNFTALFMYQLILYLLTNSP
jgi:hypothetical protein